MQPISLCFVDDHPIMLSGLCQLFASNSEFRIIGVGKNAQEALELTRTARPDVIVLDLNMPGRTLEAIARIVNEAHGTRVVVFTASECIDMAISALEAGALGYVLKGSTIEDLAEAIRQVHDAETYITPSFAAKVVTGLREQSRASKAPRCTFSKREEDVLRLLLRGSTNKEIAEALSISDKTVKHYMTVLIQKLNVRNRVEVVLAAQALASNGGLRRPAAFN